MKQHSDLRRCARTGRWTRAHVAHETSSLSSFSALASPFSPVASSSSWLSCPSSWPSSSSSSASSAPSRRRFLHTHKSRGLFTDAQLCFHFYSQAECLSGCTCVIFRVHLSVFSGCVSVCCYAPNASRSKLFTSAFIWRPLVLQQWHFCVEQKIDA